MKTAFIILQIFIIFIFIACEKDESKPWDGNNTKLTGNWSGETTEFDPVSFKVKMLSDSSIIIDSFTSHYYFSDEGMQYQIDYNHNQIVEKYPDYQGVVIKDSKFSFNNSLYDFPDEVYGFTGTFTDSTTMDGAFKIKDKGFFNINIYAEYNCTKNK